MFFEVSSLYLHCAELISRDQWLLKVTFVIQLTKRDIALSISRKIRPIVIMLLYPFMYIFISFFRYCIKLVKIYNVSSHKKVCDINKKCLF